MRASLNVLSGSTSLALNPSVTENVNLTIIAGHSSSSEVKKSTETLRRLLLCCQLSLPAHACPIWLRLAVTLWSIDTGILM